MKNDIFFYNKSPAVWLCGYSRVVVTLVKSSITCVSTKISIDNPRGVSAAGDLYLERVDG